jgi:hypothetical protein
MDETSREEPTQLNGAGLLQSQFIPPLNGAGLVQVRVRCLAQVVWLTS